MKNTSKKLTQKDYARMWGEDGPYSQVRLCEEIRILDDRVSRVFLVVEAEINPFTFEYVLKHREQFEGDEPVQQLLDHADYRDEFGYVVSAGETELDGEESRRFARKRADMTTKTLIRMHEFIIRECGLNQDSEYGVIKDMPRHNEHLVWNEDISKVESVGDELWEEETLIGSPAGIRNNKMRFFVVIAFDKEADFRKKSVIAFTKVLKEISDSFQIDIEDVQAFNGYVLIVVLIPFDVAPSKFIETILAACKKEIQTPLFQKDYLITNVKKPTQEQIMSFLHQLPLDRDQKIEL